MPDAEVSLSLVQTITSRDGTLQKDGKMVNCLIEPGDGSNSVQKRPGLFVAANLPAGQAQGQFICQGIAYAVIDDTIYNTFTGAVFAIPGVLIAGSEYQFLSDVPYGTSLLKSPSGLWTFNGFGATKVTDPDYPPTTISGIVYLDGTYYVLADDSTIRGSTLEDPTSWDALNFIGADASLGSGIAIIRHLNYLVAVFQFGMQLYYDAANATGSPLSMVSNASWRTGSPSHSTFVELQDELFFVSTTETHGRAVTKMQGLQPVLVSNPYVERILNRSNFNQCYTFGLRVAGHTLYIITMPDLHTTLVYDVMYQHWSVWSSSSGGVEENFQPKYYLNINDKDLLLDPVSGTVYQMSVDMYQDAGNPIPVTIRTAPEHNDTMFRKFFYALSMVADTSSSTLQIRYSDDDYQTFTDYRPVDLSTPRKQLQRLGSSRRRSWDFYHNANTPLRLYDCKLRIGKGYA